jgi:hypothetical protein
MSEVTYKVIPSESSRGYGPRCEINQANLPYTVVRSDGSLIASFHSRYYADTFAASQNAEVKAAA